MLRFAKYSGIALAALVLTAPAGRGDEPPAPKDDALDRLLEKLEKPAPPPAAKPDSDTAAPEPEKSKSEAPAQPPAQPTGEKKKAGEVAPKDQALDSLLEK